MIGHPSQRDARRMAAIRSSERRIAQCRTPGGTGFTLIETLVAISLLTISVVAPIALTVQSLRAAYYSRDQITAFYLAQEAIEAVRAIRDGQVLQIAQSPNGSSINLFGAIPLDQDFTIDARKTNPTQAINACSGACPVLQTDGTLYGYESGWSNTTFTRTVRAHFVGTSQDELRITVTVSWRTNSYDARTFSISEDMYRWVPDSASAS